MDAAVQVEAVTSAVMQLVAGARRQLIAIAGPPASGKSTLAVGVQSRLIDQGVPCGFVPMDGFHLDNAVLKECGLLNRKGAPNTFDVLGLKALLELLLNDDDVHVPHFDRGNDCVVENAELITKDQRHVVVEGNYLLLSSGVWKELSPLWSFRVFLESPIQVLEKRLIERWLENGFGKADVLRKVRQNDLPNAVLTLEESDCSTVDLVLS